MSGRLELTVKFSELPQPLQVQGGVKIGFQSSEWIVTAILSPKSWKKLEQTAHGYPQWVAALTGTLDQHEGEVITLKNPAVQVFEKKLKPAAPVTNIASEAPPPSVQPAQPAQPVQASPSRYLKLTLKGRTPGAS